MPALNIQDNTNLIQFPISVNNETNTDKRITPRPNKSMKIKKPEKLYSKDTLTHLYEVWKNDQTEQNLYNFVKASEPIIKNALNRFVGTQNPVLKSRGEVIVADAITKYDPSKGVQLDTFLMSQLQQLRRTAATQSSQVYLPERQRQLGTSIYKKYIELEQKFGREPTLEELADETGLSKKFIRVALKRQLTPQISEVSMSEENSALPQDIEQQMSEDEELVKDLVKYSLNKTDRALLELFEEGLSKTEIAKRMKMTPTAVFRRFEYIAKKIKETWDLYLSEYKI